MKRLVKSAVATIAASLVWCCLAQAQQPAAEAKPATRWRLPPIRIGGSISEMLGYDKISPGGQTTRSNQTLLQLNGASYVWQPWFMPVKLSIGLGVDRMKTTGYSGSSSTFANADGSLQLLPGSRIPLEAGFTVTNTELSTGGLTLGGRGKTYRISQSIKTKDNAYYTYRYSAYTSKQKIGASGGKNLSFSAAKNIGANQLNFRGDYRRSDTLSQDSLSTGALRGAVFSHQYRPDQYLTNQNLVTMLRSNEKTLATSTELRSMQLSSTVDWEPDTEKLTKVFGSARIDDTSKKAASPPSPESVADTTALAAMGSFSYYPADNTDLVLTANHAQSLHGPGAQSHALNGNLRHFRFINPNTRLTSNTSAGHTKPTSGRDLTTAGEMLNLDYNSTPRSIARFTYQWNASGLASYRYNSLAPAAFTTGASAIHSLTRTIPGKTSIFMLRLTQGGSVQGNTATLDHRAKFQSKTIIGRTGELDFSADFQDRRNFRPALRTIQTLNFQANAKQGLTRYSQISGNATWQLTRNSESLSGGTESTVTADLSYYHFRLFNVRNLVFSSTLFVNTFQTLGGAQTGTVSDLFSYNWRNELNYRVGRLQSKATYNWTGTGASSTQSLMLSVTRYF